MFGTLIAIVAVAGFLVPLGGAEAQLKLDNLDNNVEVELILALPSTGDEPATVQGILKNIPPTGPNRVGETPNPYQRGLHSLWTLPPDGSNKV